MERSWFWLCTYILSSRKQSERIFPVFELMGRADITGRFLFRTLSSGHKAAMPLGPNGALPLAHSL